MHAIRNFFTLLPFVDKLLHFLDGLVCCVRLWMCFVMFLTVNLNDMFSYTNFLVMTSFLNYPASFFIHATFK